MIHRLMLSVLLFCSIALAKEYRIDNTLQNLVTFTSDAPVEKIVGTTSTIDGYVNLQQDEGAPSGEFYFEVDLASLDTGIGLRNRHMRDNYLEVKKYPFAVFAGKIIHSEPTEDGGFNLKTRGTFDLHGVKKDVEIEGIVTTTDGGYKAASQFSVALADFKIARPQLMMLKIGEVVQVSVTFNVRAVQE